MITCLRLAIVLSLVGTAWRFLPPATNTFAEGSVITQSLERSLSRLVWFSEDRSNPIAGEFWIEYGRPEWKSEFAKALDGSGQKRWRFGADAWTTLDTNAELTVGGKKVAPGAYYVVLEHPDKDKWNLVLLDPAPLRAAKMDAFGASATTGGILIPLTYAKASKSAEKLAIAITSDKNKRKEGTIEIAFGPHKLTVAFVGSV
jgi:hypothetical protein